MWVIGGGLFTGGPQILETVQIFVQPLAETLVVIIIGARWLFDRETTTELHSLEITKKHLFKYSPTESKECPLLAYCQ